MIRKKFTLEVEATYDPEVDMGYLYLYPKEAWPPPTKGDFSIPVEIKRKDGTNLCLVCDFRMNRLVGIEFFGRLRFPPDVWAEIQEIEEDDDAWWMQHDGESIKLTQESWEQVIDMITNPKEPPEALKKLFSRKAVDTPDEDR